MPRLLTLFTTAFFALVVSGTAMAGNLTTANGKTDWQSTACPEPAEPASWLAVRNETHAGDMNTLMEAYNNYVDQMQKYMNCVSDEADTDAGATSQSIIDSAQGTIGTAQKKVTSLYDALQGKH